MDSSPRIRVAAPEGQSLNGLGMMIQQYLEQNLADFEDKVEAGLRIRGLVSVEVEKGIAVTLGFHGDRIVVENGVAPNPDLHLESSYLLLSKILSGKASPYVELLRGNIKLRTVPRRPFQSLRMLRFLEIPRELLLEKPLPKRNAYLIWILGSALGLGGLALLIYALFQLLGGS